MSDRAAGRWEFPGGHLEDGETARQAAVREWTEETGLALPPGEFAGEWASPDGIYAGFVYEVASEDALPILTGRDFASNPDDPDGDRVEALAWWSPDLLPGNPALRDEVADTIDAILAALPAPVAKADWQAPLRAVEAKAVAHHAAQVRSALTSTLPRERLASLARDYFAER